MIARAQRLMHGGAAVSEQARQKNAALHLRAWHRERVLDGMQRSPRLDPLDGEGRKWILARLDTRSHLRQRLNDALHGTLRQRFIAADGGSERLRGENAGEHSNGGSGIARVERAGMLA